MEFFKRLLSLPGPSGYEVAPSTGWREEAKGFADRVWADVAGNAFAEVNPKGEPRVMLAGHIDEIGLMVNHIDDDGFFLFERFKHLLQGTPRYKIGVQQGVGENIRLHRPATGEEIDRGFIRPYPHRSPSIRLALDELCQFPFIGFVLEDRHGSVLDRILYRSGEFYERVVRIGRKHRQKYYEQQRIDPKTTRFVFVVLFAHPFR